jgi:hypothetical protein
MVRAALRLNDRNDVAVEIIAKRITQRRASAIQTSFASGHCAIFARRRRMYSFDQTHWPAARYNSELSRAKFRLW